MPAYRNSIEHLFEELSRLDLILNLRVLAQRTDPSAAGFTEFRGLFIAEEEIDQWLPSTATHHDQDRQQQENLNAMRMVIERAERTITENVNESLKSGIDLSLPRLARLFELSPFDVDTLLICLAPELDVKYEKLYAYLQNDVTRKYPSVDLILNLCCRSLDEKLQARTRLLPQSPLVRNFLIASASETEQTSLLSRPLRIDGRVLNYLLEANAADERIDSFARVVVPQVDFTRVLLSPELKNRLATCFQEELGKARSAGCASVLILEGVSGAGKNFVTEALCYNAGRELIVADAASLLATNSKRPAAVAALFREAKLRNAVVMIDQAELLLADGEKETQVGNELARAWQSFAGVVMTSSKTSWNPSFLSDLWRWFRFVLPLPEFSLRKELWRQMLNGEGAEIETDLDFDELADRFAFSPGRIRRAVAEARRVAVTNGGTLRAVTAFDINQACRAQAGARLPNLARKIKPIFNWNDIVLPQDCLEHLREVCTHTRHRQRVFGDWAFERKVSLGKGVSILFAGASGTGKTMAAEIIANELALDLYKIDLSRIVSKYIGETEKNLSHVFAEAEQSNAILFFDEADAIFGKRSEVRDSHDRYANIEVNYLLQKMEEYEGIVILASNFQKNIDDAFTRRMRFIIEFPFPEEDYRGRMWQKVFPSETPLESDVDFEFLARKLKVSGGNIRNIALHAAFLAAANSGHVSMEHIVCAARREFQKMGRLCVKSDFEQYFELIEREEARA
jgi:SpoVK/Ycf46/Vps4 family AAA+-type ATPase